MQTTARYDKRPEEANCKAASLLHVPYLGGERRPFSPATQRPKRLHPDAWMGAWGDLIMHPVTEMTDPTKAISAAGPVVSVI